MREVNFSIPNSNKASVGITTALYDRRALDCTSTLPLINSLSNLAYLTTSSARIRDILTVDGGVERLVCILKEGRSKKDVMECWKWNLAFQCVVNIGVRGSEGVRTRVVEADMVPVIATILDNYVKVIDKCREKADAEYKRSARQHGPSAKLYAHRANELLLAGHGLERIRRQAPPPIEIPPTLRDPTTEHTPLPAFSLSSPPERTTFTRTHHQNRSTDSRTPVFGSSTPRASILNPPLITSVPTMDGTPNTFGIRPVRDSDRLPSMLPSLPAELSRPDSPTTPSAPNNLQSERHLLMRRRPERRPSIRHQLSMSGDSDDGPSDEADVNGSGGGPADDPVVGMEDEISMQDIVETEALINAGVSPVRLEPPASDPPDVDALSLARSAMESSMINHTNQGTANLTISPIQNLNAITTSPPPMQLNPYARYVQERSVNNGAISSMPRDEDVLMCLQLLAYVSKYCNLRSYFQKSHLVPKLKVPAAELLMFNDDPTSSSKALPEEELEHEYLQPDDFNIFPLVEKFTVRHHTGEMQYWAGVVMRNLCRKDDARGGIRQCAYYQCGKWEEYTRQFAKCRRCRRTKYCSKECQKSAWVFHRHWCVAATQ
jgi:hypothetical protein